MGYRRSGGAGGGGGGGQQFQMMVPFTKTVKWLVIANIAIWFVGQVVLEQFVFKSAVLTSLFGLTPGKVVENFFVWQVFTYMFLHDLGPFHILFNMLILWWLGSELEGHWGSKFFRLYYFVCGIGAALIYVFSTVIYGLIVGDLEGMFRPVIGASGAIFGLMLAYGIIFGERVVYFMFVFPMKARYFVMILGAIEFVMLLNNGVKGGDTANLAHLGGLLSGFLFLMFWTRWLKYSRQKQTSKGGRKLRLVVDNDDPRKGPKYWN